MKSPISPALSLLAGAALMYFFDPDQGRARRARVQEHLVARVRHGTEGTRGPDTRSLGTRIEGVMAQARGRWRRGSEEFNERRLYEAVRARIGRLVDHPRAIGVAVEGRRVTLSGHVLASEERHLLWGVSTLPGVEHLENRLAVHESSAQVPELKGRPRRVGRSSTRPSALALAAPLFVAFLVASYARVPR